MTSWDLQSTSARVAQAADSAPQPDGAASLSEDQGSGLKVVIDRVACCGYGLCAEICPEVYKLDAGGIVFVESDIIPAGLEDKAIEGAQACPQAALSIEKIERKG